MYRNFTEYANQLQKVKDAMDLWIEAFDTFGAATLMLSEAFKGFFAFKPMIDDDAGPPLSSPYLPVAEGFSDVAKKLNRTILPSVRQLFEIRCLQPIAAILAMVGPIDVLLSERKTVMLDFDSYRAKIEKEHAAGRDSRHPLVIKKALKLDEVAKQLHSLNTTIHASFVEFEKARSVTMGPEFTSFMACFFHFTSYSAELSGKVLPDIPQIASSLYILESFIGQSFNTPAFPNSDEENSAPVDGFASEDSAATAKRAQVEVVTERSEYAGGEYGGYSSQSIVLPASYKDDEIEQQIENEQAMSEVLDIDDAATSETSEFTSSTFAPVDVAATLRESEMPNTGSSTADAAPSVGKEKAITVETIRSLLPASAPPPPPAKRTFMDNAVIAPAAAAASPSTPASLDPPLPSESEPSSPFTPAPGPTSPEPTAAPAHNTLSSHVVPAPASASSHAPSPAQVLLPPVDATPPKRTSLFSAFFSSSRSSLPVAKPVAAMSEILTSTPKGEEDEDIPMAEAKVDVRPEKPPKTIKLQNSAKDLSEGQPEFSLEAQTSTAEAQLGEAQYEKKLDHRSSSPLPARSGGDGESSPGFRSTIALARGSVAGDMSGDMGARKPMDASSPIAAPLKPLKPPKLTKPPLPAAALSLSSTGGVSAAQTDGGCVDTPVDDSAGVTSSNSSSSSIPSTQPPTAEDTEPLIAKESRAVEEAVTDSSTISAATANSVEPAAEEATARAEERAIKDSHTAIAGGSIDNIVDTSVVNETIGTSAASD